MPLQFGLAFSSTPTVLSSWLLQFSRQFGGELELFTYASELFPIKLLSIIGHQDFRKFETAYNVFLQETITFCLVIVARGSTSTHLVKQSMLTTKNFLSLKDDGNGLRMSNPYRVNSQGELKYFSQDLSALSMFTNLQHLLHFLPSLMCLLSQLAKNTYFEPVYGLASVLLGDYYKFLHALLLWHTQFLLESDISSTTLGITFCIIGHL